MLKKIIFAISIIFLWTTGAAQQLFAQAEPLTYDRINFSVSAQQEVENDTINASLYVQREGNEAGKLADEVNAEITWAVELAKKSPAVKVQTMGYQTFPVYSKTRLSGWRVRQSISLETDDSSELSTLLGTLQSRLAIQSIYYSISHARRQKVEKQLIEEALAGFTERAKLVAAQLNRSDYRIVNLNISTQDQSQPRYRTNAPMMMAEKASVSPPSLEAGEQSLSVVVHGTIELQVK